MFIKLFKTAFEFEVKVNAPYTTIYVKFPLFNLAILAIFSKNRNVTK